MTVTKIILKSGKDEAVRRFHPWVFSGAIKKMHGEPGEGEVVEVYSNQDQYLASGHYQIGSIAVRLFSWEKEDAGLELWKNKIRNAYQYREQLGLINNAETNAYRLVFAEGDGLPGLVIDYYNGTAVMQMHSIGMYHARQEICEALKDIYGDSLKAVYDKSAETLPRLANINATNGFLYGNPEDIIISENGLRFHIDIESGQKTGFFLDQRESRALLRKYSSGKSVLNTFSYTGGFSVYAITAGALRVDSVDSSKKAVELAEKNVLINAESTDRHHAIAADVMEFIKDCGNYDIIVLDPPAFAKHNDVRHNAIQGYKRLNVAAIQKLNPGGLLFTFSCSQVVDRNLFNSTISSAAIVCGRKARVVHQLSQAPDHPFSPFHPEGQYLKGLVVRVD